MADPSFDLPEPPPIPAEIDVIDAWDAGWRRGFCAGYEAHANQTVPPGAVNPSGEHLRRAINGLAAARTRGMGLGAAIDIDRVAEAQVHALIALVLTLQQRPDIDHGHARRHLPVHHHRGSLPGKRSTMTNPAHAVPRAPVSDDLVNELTAARLRHALVSNDHKTILGTVVHLLNITISNDEQLDPVENALVAIVEVAERAWPESRLVLPDQDTPIGELLWAVVALARLAAEDFVKDDEDGEGDA